MKYAVHIKGPDMIRAIIVDVEGKPTTSGSFILLGDSWFRSENIAAIVSEEDCSESLGTMYP